MNPQFKELMSKKSEDGLMEYITNIGRYTPESILAAVEELTRRGQFFTDEERAYIKMKIDEKILTQESEDELWSISAVKKGIVQFFRETRFNLNKLIKESSDVLGVKMGKKSMIRTIILLLVVVLAFVPINIATLLFLWLFYGESAQGSIDSANAYELFPIRHLPIVLPIIVLTILSARTKLWRSNKEKAKSNFFVAVGGVILYALFEFLDLFYS